MDKLADVNFWQQLLALTPVNQGALVMALAAGMLFPPGIEHSIPAAKRPGWLWWASLVIACLLCMAIAICFADTTKHGFGLGLESGSVCHFGRWGLSFVPGLKWIMAKPAVDVGYDAQGNVEVHVDGIDHTLVARPPAADATQPKPEAKP